LLPKLEAILPVSGAKGLHVYVASSTTKLTSELLANEIGPGSSDNENYEASGSTKVGQCDGKIDGGDGKIDGGERTHPGPKMFSVTEMEAMMMDVDAAQIPTLSVSSSKRKFSALRNDKSDTSPPPSEPTATSEMTTSEHAGKKRSTGKGKQPVRSAEKDKQPRKISARKAADISNAAVLHGMQGTMNRVSDIFERSVTQPLDPQSATRTDALHFLQTRDDNLSLEQTTKMVRLFMKDNVAAETYIALVNTDLRRSWLADMLDE
jgi:hypothetical protein